MMIGIVVQSLAITAATLGAFLIGLKWFPEQVEMAETMAFATLSISELLRAYTSRSERYNLFFHVKLFSNRVMQYAVLASLVILMIVMYVPGLQGIFNTTTLGWRPWSVVLPLLLVPSIAAEITKVFLRRRAERLEGTEALPA
jgi:Ca2+-transporting ATPase